MSVSVIYEERAKPTMSGSLHSCHWDWCRFTTEFHDEFVQHVIKAHVDKAEPVKKEDINLIRHVEQGASNHSGGISSYATTSSQSEALQSVSQSGPSTANHPVIRKREDLQTINGTPMFPSSSINSLRFPPKEQQTSVSGFLAVGETQDISQFEPRTQAAYQSQNFD